MNDKGIYIYGLYLNGSATPYYVGSTNSFSRRIKEHTNDLKNGKHKNKALQKEFDKLDDKENGLAAKEILSLPNVENSFIKYFTECLVISYYHDQPNAHIVNFPYIQSGFNKFKLPTVPKQLAYMLLTDIEAYYDIHLHL